MEDSSSTYRHRILVADDEKSIADAVATMMGMSGMEAIVVNDGTAADAALAGGEADAAILDVMMPGMSGFEVLKSARGRGDRTPILMLTALTTIDDKMNGFDSGADDYLPKPFDMRELVARTSILAKQDPYASGTMDIDGITLNMSKSMVSNTAGSSLPLTDIESSVLSYLCAHRPAVRIGRLAEIASKSSGSEVSEGAVTLAAATVTSKLRQLGSGLSVSKSGGSLVIAGVGSSDAGSSDAGRERISDAVRTEPSRCGAENRAENGNPRRKPVFPWRIGR